MHNIKVADRQMDRDHDMTTSTFFGMLFLKVGLCHNQTVPESIYLLVIWSSPSMYI